MIVEPSRRAADVFEESLSGDENNICVSGCGLRRIVATKRDRLTVHRRLLHCCRGEIERGAPGHGEQGAGRRRTPYTATVSGLYS